MIPPHDIDGAIHEARRAVHELGFKTVFVRPNPVHGRNWHDPFYEPLWSALESLDVPLGFHEANNSAARQAGEQFGYDFMLRHTFSHPVEQMYAVGSFCGGGILYRALPRRDVGGVRQAHGLRARVRELAELR